jgi:hypothetical protein
MNFKVFLLPIFILIFIFDANGQGFDYQKHFTVGAMAGFSNYSGDIAENRIVIGETKVGFSGVFRYHFARHFAVRGHFLKTVISGDDANSENLKFRQFTFRTPISEIGLAGEYYLFEKDRVTSTGVFSRTLTPYAFAGIAGTFINPEVTYPGTTNWIAETQKKSHVIPFGGVGFRADLAPKFILNLEVGLRPTFQDDIDGVSKNGNTDRNDWYYFFGIGLDYVLGDPSKIKRDQ